MNLISFSVRNPVVVNMLIVLILVTGFPVYFLLVRELFPILPQDRILVFTIYPEASPEDVEKQITAAIEREILAVDGIKNIFSTSMEGRSSIILELESDANPSSVIRDVEAEIEQIDTFPDEAEEPEVRELKYDWPIVNIGLRGPLAEKRLNDLADELKDLLLEIDGISRVIVVGAREREIHVLANLESLYSYDISLPMLAEALLRDNRDLPAGAIETQRQEFLLRTQEDFTDLESIRNVILRVNQRGGRVCVADVATVADSFEDRTNLARVNGENSVVLLIQKTPVGDTLRIKKNIDRAIDQFARSHPEPIIIEPFLDFSFAIRERIRVMQYNGLMGLSLVLVCLCLFLNFRVSMMVAIGIPFSFLCAILIMYGYGMSLNMLTMFGMIIVLGMLVDDAIIIAENCYRYMEQGVPKLEAAMVGTKEVALPVIAAVLTTCAAFLPLLLMEGLMGKFLGVIPIVVTFALLSSLFEAFVVLPCHIAEWTDDTKVNAPSRSNNKHWYTIILSYYRIVLKCCLRGRYAVCFAVIGVALFSVWFAIYQMDFILFQNKDIKYFKVNLELPVGAKLDRTAEIMSLFEKKVKELPENEIESIVAYLGYQVDEWGRLQLGGHLGQLWVDLTETSLRDRLGIDVMNAYRDSIPPIAEAKSIQFEKETAGPPQGAAVSVRVRGEDWSTLSRIVNEIETYLSSIDGVVDIRNNYQAGKTEYRIKIDRERAAQLGLSTDMIANTMRYSIEGGEAGTFFDQDDQLDIIVRLDKKKDWDYSEIQSIRFLSQQGKWIPFTNFAELIPAQGYSEITRFNNRRAITITAEVITDKITSVEVNSMLCLQFTDRKETGASMIHYLASLLLGTVETTFPCKGYPGYSLAFGGENEETQRSLSSLMRAFIVSLVLIYFIMGAVFRSYIQPLIVLFTIPFSLIGVIWGLYCMGQPIGIMALIGVISLNGIVVNDAIVMVDFINNKRDRGLGRWRSVYQAGIMRVRPIILTSVTTIGGLLPLTVWATGSSEFLSPMAIAISWGLGFATVLTLLVLPCIHSIVDDGLHRKKKQRRADAGYNPPDASAL